MSFSFSLSDDFNRVPIKLEEEASHDSEAEDEDEYSTDEDDEIPTKYINASFVDVNISLCTMLKSFKSHPPFSGHLKYPCALRCFASFSSRDTGSRAASS